MDIILGKVPLNKWTYKDLRERIVRVSTDRSLQSYPNSRFPFLRNFTDYENANRIFNNRQARPSLEGFKSTLSGFGTIVRELESKWDKMGFVVLAYGAGMMDSGEGGPLPEQLDTAEFALYMKTLGGAGFGHDARYPEYTKVNGEHQAILFSAPHPVLQNSSAKLLLYRGTIGPYSNIDGLKADRVPYVREPVTGHIVWRLEN